jgi:carbamoyltransferase
MIILGISALDTDSTATLFVDNKIVGAIAEERMSRKKLQNGFPRKALRRLFDDHGVRPTDIDVVAYPFFEWQQEGALISKHYAENMAQTAMTDEPVDRKLNHAAHFSKWAAQAVLDHRHYTNELHENLTELGLRDKLERVDHHMAHAASAYYCSGYDRALVVTLDWYGGGLAGMVAMASPTGIEVLKKFKYPHSLGLFYAQVTAALGFKPTRHEGKIVGLASFGEPEILFDQVFNRFEVLSGDYRYKAGMDMTFCKKLAQKYDREDIAAAYQAVLERVVTLVTKHYVRRENIDTVVLAGGVAANVKMNQRVLEIEGVRRVFVHPNMGDGGTGTGAAILVASRRGGLEPWRLHDVYFGPEYSEKEMEDGLQKARMEYTRPAEIEVEIARLVHEGKVVARFNGRMEYGPRALGNRSILYHTIDPTVNDWLNKRLKRTEFMPFAPATLWETRHDCFHNIEGGEFPAEYMTITFDCKPFMKQSSPAAVHVDGTARPQLVKEEVNPSFYKVIKEYHKLSGIPSIVNTSFNMHEEPIVCSPKDAIRAFNLGNLDYLALGPFLAKGQFLAG